MSVSRQQASELLEFYAKGQSAAEETVTDVSVTIVPVNADAAFTLVTLLSVTAGDVYYSIGSGGVVGKGTKMQLGVTFKFFGGQSLKAICSTAAATAEIAFQVFKIGRSLESGADIN